MVFLGLDENTLQAGQSPMVEAHGCACFEVRPRLGCQPRVDDGLDGDNLGVVNRQGGPSQAD